MPSIFSLEGASHRPRLWTADERPRTLGLGDNALVSWMKAQPLPVAAAASVALSLGVGFVVSLAFLKVIGKGGKQSAPVSGARRRRRRN